MKLSASVEWEGAAGSESAMHGLSGPFALLGVVLALAASSLLGGAPAASAETYREAVESTAGVSHFWPMGEASGGSFADAVGGANAAVSGGVTLGEPGGLVGDASTSVLFDGSSGAAQANVDLSGTHELTVEFWMKWSAYGSDDHLALEFTPNFNDYEGGFLVDPDATPGSDFAVSIGLGPSSNTVFFERPSAGEWHYYAFVIDTEASAEEEITPYVDGHPVSYTKSRTGTGAGNFADSTLFWMSRDASTLFGAGSMQDLALYETALSPSTILHHYALGAVGPKASFTDAPVVATAGVPVRLNAAGSSSTVGPITDYAWDFNGAKTYGSDAGESPTTSHTFTEPGTYTVDLKVTESEGKTGTVSKTITVGAALSPYEQAVESSDGLAHFWPMGEAGGESSLADVFSGADAEVLGGVTLGEPGDLVGDSSTSAAFDGSSGAARAAVDLSGTHELTVEFWMKWSAYGADDRLALEFTPDFNEHVGGFLVDPDATPGSDFAVSVGKGSLSTANTVLFERPSAGVWHYYAFVIDTEAPAETEITPYVDGHAVAYTKSESDPGAGAFADSTLYWMSRDASTLFGAGSMQDLALYETTLSASTIAAHYEAGEGGPKASFSSTPVVATAGVPVHLDASGSSSPGGSIADYAWDFDGSESYSEDAGGTPTVSHTFSSPGTYTVDLRVKDTLGETATVSHTITVGAALGQYEQAVEETAGLSHFWPMGESSGSSFADAIDGANASLAGGVTLDEPGGLVGDSSTSAAFDGSSGAAQANVDLSGTHELTVEFWMKWSAYGADDRLALEFTPDFNEHVGGFLVDPDATPGSDFAVSVGKGSLSTANTVLFERPSAGAWHYYAFVIDTEAPSETEITPYVDGQAVAYTKTESDSGAGAFADSTLYWMSRDASTLFGAGSMQDLALYETTLSSDTILEHYERGENTYASLFGSEGSGDGEFEHPGDVAIAPDGDLWVLDTGDDRVERFSEGGEYLGQFGSEGSGAGQLKDPESIAVDAKGDVWVADTGNNRLEVFSESGEYLKTVGSHGTGNGRFESPEGIAVAPNGLVWVADTGNARVEVFGEEGSYLTKIGSRGSGAGQFEGPAGVAIGSNGDVWVVDRPDDRVEEFDGETYEYVRQLGSYGRGEGELMDPFGVAVDAAGNVWVGDVGDDRVEEFDEEGEYVAQLGAEGSEDGDLSLSEPMGLATNVNGDKLDIWVTDPGNDRVEKWTLPVAVPSNVVLPEVSGFAQAGQELSASTGSWSGVRPISYSYQWKRCVLLGGECTAITGATASTYTPASGDVGHTLIVQVTATNAGGSNSIVSLATSEVLPVAPVNTLAPSLSSGTPEEGVGESATTGTWTGEPTSYSYQWQSCDEEGEECADIEGETDETYRPAPGDVGDTLRVVVTASNAGGSESASSPASAVVSTPVMAPVDLVSPEISGSAQQGQTLTAIVGTWTGAPPLTYGYQWERCDSEGESCAAVPGATEAIYTLSSGDVGSTLRVLITATDAEGHASQISPASVIVEGHTEAASSCTDTWIASAEGRWGEGTNWSTGSAPTSSDVACVGAEASVYLGEGEAEQVGVLEDQGSLAVVGGSLEITDTTLASTVDTLELAGLHGELTGAGSLDIAGGLEWKGDATMSGSGQTVLDPAAMGTLGSSTRLAGRKFDNEGSLTFADGYFELSDGAQFENSGTFKDNADTANSCCTSDVQIYIEPGAGGPAPSIVNKGLFEKTEGTGVGVVAVPFTNDGTVSALSGTLEFDDGGVSGQASTGAWSVESGGSILLTEGDFTIGEAVSLSAVTVEGATVTRVAAPALTSSPSLSGTAQAGDTLTASSGSWTGAEPISFAYQWQLCNSSGAECQSIPGASGDHYTPGPNEEGATLRALVTASDAYGQTLASSPASAVVASPPAPSNTALPAISGAAEDGATLTASTGSWSAIGAISYTYEWESCILESEVCAPVEGATEPGYELTEGDIGSTLRVRVTATNTGGSTEAVSATSPEIEAEPPSELLAPSVAGTPDVHNVLHAEPGAWTGTETQLSYQWESCSESGSECAPVEGATSPEYDLAEGDLATTLRVRIGVHSAVDSLSDVSPVTPVIGAAGAFAGTQPPSISGAPQVNQTLTAGQGAWTGGTGEIGTAYQWQSCNQFGESCTDIESATKSSYAPVSGEAGHRLRVLVTATDEEHHSASQTSQATQPVASASAPVVEQQPPLTGTALVGQTMSAGTGVFAGESSLSYIYQWEGCTTGGGSCEAIEGATHSSYTLTEGDVGYAIVALVSATDETGSTTAMSAPTAVVGAEQLAKLSTPSISGLVQVEGTLSADPGIWSAAGPVTYAYQWQSCNLSGADCASIEGATEPTYTVGSGDLGATLRVRVTATSPLGDESAVSAPTAAPPGGEVSTEEAQEILDRTDPAVLAPSTTATLEGESIAPALGEAEEELAAHSTLTSSTISKETAGEFAVNTPAGESSFAPVESSPHATTLPTIVNGAAALFANTWPATDTVVRPGPLGANTILQIRSAEAPRTFSWEAHLGPDQELEQLPNGSVAVIETSEDKAAPNSRQTSSKTYHLRYTTGEQPETSEEKAEAEQAETEANSKEEESPEKRPLAPQSEASTGEAGHGQPQPQDTHSSYEAAKSAMSYAEAHTAGNNALAVIAAPNVTDAEGNIIPVSLTVTGSTITMTIKPATDPAYPLLADTTVAAPTNKQSIERDPVKYGLADPLPQNEGHVDEHFEENGSAIPGVDPNLFNGPPHTSRHIRTERLIVPYDMLLKLHGQTPKETTELEGYRQAERHRLEAWLEKLKDEQETTHEEIEPYITFGQDYVSESCKTKSKCTQPTIRNYTDGVAWLIDEVIMWHKTNGWPLVKLWGAWNEPDLSGPLEEDAPRAAQFWEIAKSDLNGITHYLPCPGCEVVAGEFATNDPPYPRHYRNVILHGYASKTSHTYYYKRYWFGQREPAVWGFHDYEDLEHHDKDVAEAFAKFAHESPGTPKLIMSEAGVDLQNGKAETPLGELETKTEGGKEEKRELQQEAAETYLHLSEGLTYHIDRMYYYEYTSPTLAEQHEHQFDSALLEVEKGKPLRERPAYCVLAYEKHVCPPTAEVEPEKYIDGAGACEAIPTSVQLRGSVDPGGAKTASYYFEYGLTPSYGLSTPIQTLHDEAGSWISNPVIKATVATTIGEGRCPDTIYFRLVATNAQGRTKGMGHEVDFNWIEPS